MTEKLIEAVFSEAGIVAFLGWACASLLAIQYARVVKRLFSIIEKNTGAITTLTEIIRSRSV